MPFKIERLPDEPILIVTIEDHIDAEVVRGIFIQTAAMFAQIEGAVVYRIADIRTAKTNFVDVIKIIKTIRSGIPASSIDPRIRGVFVGRNHFARMYADFIRQFGGAPIPFFETVEEAVEYARINQTMPARAH